MILKSNEIAQRLKDTEKKEDPLVITPSPDLDDLERKVTASVDLRLGTWFLTQKTRRHCILDVTKRDSAANPNEEGITSKYYVPFGKEFYLHPQKFVLAITLEWIRLPETLTGFVYGKSSWGRRGLIIETAPGIHPGFTGCLTLELTNVGEIPIAIQPGMRICQLYLHENQKSDLGPCESSYIGQRQPSLGEIKLDEYASALNK